MCWWFDSALGHQEHRSRNANLCRLAFLFPKQELLVSGLFPVRLRLMPSDKDRPNRPNVYRVVPHESDVTEYGRMIYGPRKAAGRNG